MVNRDDIVRMARDIGMDEVGPGIFMFEDYELKQLFDLVFAAGATAKREECMQIVHDTYEGFGEYAKGVAYVKQRIIDQIRERGEK